MSTEVNKSNIRHTWTDEDKNFTIESFGVLSNEEVASTIGTTVGSLKAMQRTLGLVVSVYSRRKWTSEEDEQLKSLAPYHTVKELEHIMDIAYNKIKSRLTVLGIEAKKNSIFSEDGTMKRCARCKEFKSLDEFGIHNKKTGKLRTKCKICEYDYHLERRLLNSKPKKPTFDEFIANSKNKERFCIYCNTRLTAKNSQLFYSGRSEKYELASSCKTCTNKQRQENRIKSIEKRGY